MYYVVYVQSIYYLPPAPHPSDWCLHACCSYFRFPFPRLQQRASSFVRSFVRWCHALSPRLSARTRPLSLSHSPLARCCSMPPSCRSSGLLAPMLSADIDGRVIAQPAAAAAGDDIIIKSKATRRCLRHRIVAPWYSDTYYIRIRRLYEKDEITPRLKLT